MGKEILVSVIIPVFNVKPFLEEALDSLVSQSYSNIEILIIDDGSTDGSGEICDKYAQKDNRIRVFHQENKGLSAARNHGLEISTGDAICFLDSDDSYRCDFVEKMAGAIMSENVEIAICKYANYMSIDEMIQQKPADYKPTIKSGIYRKEYILSALADRKVNHSVWNKIYCKYLWSDLRFPEGHVFEDISTTFQVINKCKKNICVLEEPLYNYRNRSNSIITTRTEKNIRDMILSMSCFEIFIQAHIPDVFSKDQLNMNRQLRLSQMIELYLQMEKSNTQDGDYRTTTELQKNIQKLGRDVGLGDVSFRFRICYWMIRFAPRLFEVLYPVYCKRHFTWKNT